VFHAECPWALFRLFNMGTITPGPSSERFTLSFKQGERSVDFDVRAGSVYNPFAPGVLQGFSCPNITP
jgi:type VI secretion system protein ImpL